MRFEIRAGGALLFLIGLAMLSGAVFALGLIAGYEMARQNQVDSSQLATNYPLPANPQPAVASPSAAPSPAVAIAVPPPESAALNPPAHATGPAVAAARLPAAAPRVVPPPPPPAEEAPEEASVPPPAPAEENPAEPDTGVSAPPSVQYPDRCGDGRCRCAGDGWAAAQARLSGNDRPCDHRGTDLVPGEGRPLRDPGRSARRAGTAARPVQRRLRRALDGEPGAPEELKYRIKYRPAAHSLELDRELAVVAAAQIAELAAGARRLPVNAM